MGNQTMTSEIRQTQIISLAWRLWKLLDFGQNAYEIILLFPSPTG